MVLINSLQELIETFSKYVFEKQSSPSYVEMYAGNNIEIIFVHAKVK